jgi:hypothetical protein
MRRVLSITTVLALLSTIMSPIMAAACTGTGKAVSCHAMPVAHCDRATHQHHHMDEMPSSTPAVFAGEDDEKCPMDCCIQGHTQSIAAPATISVLPQLAVSDRNFYFVPVTFTTAGFSSHTDRGPPRA